MSDMASPLEASKIAYSRTQAAPYEAPDKPTVTVFNASNPLPAAPPVPEEQRRAVVLGYLHGEFVHGRFHQSIVDLVIADAVGPRRLLGGYGGLIELESGPNVATARNDLVRRFLGSKADWLWMCDADMVIPVDTLERLMEVADEDRAPIVGALCFSAGTDGVLPTLYDLTGTAEQPRPVRYTEYPPDAMFQVFATGAACLLVHRKVFKAIEIYRDPDGNKPQFGFSYGYPWFQETELSPGMRMSEDVTFCFRAGIAGFPVYVHTGIEVGHRKSKTFTSLDFWNPAAEVKP